MELLVRAVEAANDLLWGPLMLAFFLLTGFWISLRCGFFQLRHGGLWLKKTLGAMVGDRRVRRSGDRKSISQFQALTTALAATIGTGSVAGVATAIFYGGPGAVFWMWISALLGMMLSYGEKLLGIRYRLRGADGSWRAGAMLYMERGLGKRGMALVYAFFCILASLGMGNMAQSSAITSSLGSAFGLDRRLGGLLAAVLLLLVVLGGLGRIARLSERLVPAMAGLFLVGGLMVILVHREALPGVLQSIFTEAFAPKPALGGALGYGILAAMRHGISTGVFSNEAGMGSSVLIHGAADVKEPAEQGMWGIFEVFLDTMVICTVTALVVLCSGAYDPGASLAELARLAADPGSAVDPGLLGAPLCVAAFSTVFGAFGEAFVALSISLFAFSSLFCWEYYGEQSLDYLGGGAGAKRIYRILFLVCAVLGGVLDLGLVWKLSAVCNGLMAIPNLGTLLALSPQVRRETKRYLNKH